MLEDFWGNPVNAMSVSHLTAPELVLLSVWSLKSSPSVCLGVLQVLRCPKTHTWANWLHQITPGVNECVNVCAGYILILYSYESYYQDRLQIHLHPDRVTEQLHPVYITTKYLISLGLVTSPNLHVCRFYSLEFDLILSLLLGNEWDLKTQQPLKVI